MGLLHLFHKGFKWATLFFVFVVLQHIFGKIHPLLDLVQIPIILLFSFLIFRLPLGALAVFAIGFLSDLVFFSPDGVYVIAVLLFFILSTISWNMFHIETPFAMLMYCAGGMTLFFAILLVLYSAAVWALDSRFFFGYWSPLWFASSLGINMVVIVAIYGSIAAKRRVFTS